jgi:hypothetical protein
MEVVNTTTTTDPVNMYNYLNNLILNPIVFIIIFLIIVAYFVFSSSLGNNNNFSLGNGSSTNEGNNILGVIIISILVILILVNAFQYFFSINVTAYINGLFTPTKTIDIVVDQSTYQPLTVPEIKFRKQVFNIPGNNYNYENAKAICSAYGANLATYQQIEDAYENGAEWCNYGWSQDQMALFPTQQQTYNKLQTIDGHNHDCGRPGINGGYIANPEVKFGVNCYGYKPKINDEEEDLMKTSSPYPETAKDLAFQKRVDYWKNNIDDVLVSPFNNNRWSEL